MTVIDDLSTGEKTTNETNNRNKDDLNKDAQFWKMMFLLACIFSTSNPAEQLLPKPPMHNPSPTNVKKPAQWIMDSGQTWTAYHYPD